MLEGSSEWESYYTAGVLPDDMLLVGFKTDELKPLTGKTLAEVAEMRGTAPQVSDTDLIIDNGSRLSPRSFGNSDDVVAPAIA